MKLRAPFTWSNNAVHHDLGRRRTPGDGPHHSIDPTAETGIDNGVGCSRQAWIDLEPCGGDRRQTRSDHPREVQPCPSGGLLLHLDGYRAAIGRADIRPDVDALGAIEREGGLIIRAYGPDF